MEPPEPGAAPSEAQPVKRRMNARHAARTEPPLLRAATNDTSSSRLFLRSQGLRHASLRYTSTSPSTGSTSTKREAASHFQGFSACSSLSPANRSIGFAGRFPQVNLLRTGSSDAIWLRLDANKKHFRRRRHIRGLPGGDRALQERARPGGAGARGFSRARALLRPVGKQRHARERAGGCRRRVPWPSTRSGRPDPIPGRPVRRPVPAVPARFLGLSLHGGRWGAGACGRRSDARGRDPRGRLGARRAGRDPGRRLRRDRRALRTGFGLSTERRCRGSGRRRRHRRGGESSAPPGSRQRRARSSTPSMRCSTRR